MAKKRAIELFRTGEHTDSAGHKHTFSSEIVGAIASTYDRAAAPAPVVVGHPSADAPAYGWVEGLTFNATTGRMDASLDLHDDMEAAITAKHFNKVSAAFFTPDHPSNPKKGSFYLRHVGLLGGAAPAVTGLKPFGFADVGEAHTFSDGTGPVLSVEFALQGESSIIEQLANALFAAIGKERTAPAPLFSLNPSFTAQRPPENDTMNDADKARMTALETENATLKAAAETEKKTRFAAEANTFADGLITAKKIDPAQKTEIVATYLAMAALPAVSFASGDGTTVNKQPIDSWKATFATAAPVIDTASKTDPDGKAKGVTAAQFTAPDNTSLDPESAQLHNKVVAYMAKANMKPNEYATALELVLAGNTA